MVAHLKIEFTEGDKCYNLMSRLNYDKNQGSDIFVDVEDGLGGEIPSHSSWADHGILVITIMIRKMRALENLL